MNATDEDAVADLAGKIIDVVTDRDLDLALTAIITAFIALNNHFAANVEIEREAATEAAEMILEAAGAEIMQVH